MLDPDDVRTRWLALQEPGAAAALKADREAAVVDVVWMDGLSEDHRPEPYWQQQLGRTPGRRLDGPAREATRVGLDAAGRPVIAVRPIVGGHDLITWSGDRAELVVAFRDEVEQLRVLAFDGGRPFELIATRGNTRPDGRPCVEVVRYDHDPAGRVVLALCVYESGSARSWDPEKGPYWVSTATRFTHDEDGALILAEHLVGPREIARGGDHDAALAAARGNHESATVIWDARISAREDDVPVPARAFDGLAAPLADAIHTALTETRDRVGRLAFVVVDLGGFGAHGRRAPLHAAAAGVAYRDRARAMVANPDEVVNLAHSGGADAAELDVIAAAGPELQRRLRAARQALEGRWELSERMTPRLAAGLARELDARDWPDADAGFLALVRAENDAGPTRAALGDERVDAFEATLAATGVAVGDDERVAHRDALAAFLERAGLAAAEAARVAEDAAWAIVLEPGGTGETRLGGLPLLPAGMPWPTAGERPLTHLATIALTELPEVEGRNVLPPDGHLSFFADLSEAAELYEPIEPGEPGRELVAVVHTPEGAPTHRPEPPDGPPRDEFEPSVVLDERRVRPTARLQIRYVGFRSAATRFGIDAVGESVLQRLAYAVNGTVHHQLLGFPAVAQDDPRPEGHVALFHLADDHELGFNFLDAGDLLFFGAPEDIRARAWDQLTVWPSSG